MSDPIVHLQSVQYSWDKKTPLLNLDNFQVDAGEKVFLYGPSGSGKSTFLNLITGVVTPQLGQINILGTALERLSHRQRDKFRAQHMGVVFQQFNLIPYLDVIDNLRLRIDFLPSLKRQQALLQIQELIQQLQLEGVSRKQAFQLSVGQQQRVALARAILGSPDIIIADEPTSALDHDLREEFMQLLFQVAGQNTCIIFVSHDQSLKSRFDRAVSIQSLRQSAENMMAGGI